jgi:DNA repair photolyase
VRPTPLQNPPNPWATTEVEWLGEPPNAPLRVHEERARSILSENDSPDVPFKWSLNPYRGCQHACAYCYARPTHQYLGFGAGTDFDREIVVKLNAHELLRDAFTKRSWRGEAVTFSGNTDCYQPLEASFHLTRRCLEVCLEFRNPVHLITKSALIRRDLALLGELARRARCGATISIPFCDDEMGRKIEPMASACSQRFETIRMLIEAGVPTSVIIAPVIPGLNDTQIPEILERARAAGATRAAMIPLRLASEVLPVFMERLAAEYPQRVGKVESAIVQIRRGKMNEASFGERMVGHGPRWEAIVALFESSARRLGFEGCDTAEGGYQEPPTTFRRSGAQQDLF